MFKLKKKFPFYYQVNSIECGLACLRMIAKYWGKSILTSEVRAFCEVNKSGVSLYGLCDAAKKMGLEATGVKIGLDALKEQLEDSPVIMHWRKSHFVVVYKYKRRHFFIADPAIGKIKVSEKDFLDFTLKEGDLHFVHAIIAKPGPGFSDNLKSPNQLASSFKFIATQIRKFKFLYWLLAWGILLGMVTQFLLPFFTKNIVDYGIQSKSLEYITYLLIGQFVLILSGLVFSLMRGWISLVLTSKLSFSLVSSLLRKLFALPIGYFENTKIGDVLQRMGDHYKVEGFISKTAVSILFSVLSIIVSSLILAYFNILLFFIICCLIVVYVCWGLKFLKKRKFLNYKAFEISSKSQTNIVQMVQGVQDLKIYNSSEKQIKKWESLYKDQIDNSFDSLKISQLQEVGTAILFQTTQIIITFLTVGMVITDRITVGTMLSIQFILGQLLSPIQQIIGNLVSIQDFMISLERLSDIWSTKDEHEKNQGKHDAVIDEDAHITFQDLYFSYPGLDNSFALNDVSMQLEKGKVTAIVGLSGSGKTSIIKLLLGYYDNYAGDLFIGDRNLKEININSWREQCGVVMQDSFIFTDTIAENICLGKTFDLDRLREVLRIVNLLEYVESLPLQFDTVIGQDGKGLSQGQKQRILIARAVYRDPEYYFLDEATNSLDAENERIILHNLKKVFVSKTVVIIAHRLSTIQFADKIILLENGKIIEAGSHDELLDYRGRYFGLVESQMISRATPKIEAV